MAQFKKRPPLAWVLTVLGVICLGLLWYFVGPARWLYYASVGLILALLAGLLIHFGLGAVKNKLDKE